MKSKPLFVAAALFLAAAFSSAGCLGILQAQEEYLQEFDVDPGTGLEVYNRNGKITIESWDGETVEVWALKESWRGEGELEKVEIRVEEAAGRLVVESDYLQRNARVSVQYRLRIPRGVEVMRADSSNGSIELKDVAGDAVLTTSNGNIEISGGGGTVEARTSNGSISISGVRGIRSARTSNGSIEAEVQDIGEDIDVRTSNGSITLYLAPGLNAELSARTSNGKVEARGLQLDEQRVESSSLQGRLGEGGPRLEVSTSNGSIELNAM